MHKINLGTGEAAEFYNIEHIPIAESVVHPNYDAATLDNDCTYVNQSSHGILSYEETMQRTKSSSKSNQLNLSGVNPIG